MSLVEVRHLTISFQKQKTVQTVVKDVSFTLEAGTMTGLVGESGSGKTMTALAISGLLKNRDAVITGEVNFDGQPLHQASPEVFRNLLGDDISMIFQEPMTSLNPTRTVGWQVEEALRLHTNMTAEQRKNRAMEALQEAELFDTQRIYESYPHMLSGGQRQRVMIAAAMVCRPKLLIADEPTTALDVTVQAQIIALLRQLSEKHGTAILFISHDLNLVRSLCSHMMVMQNGVLVERADSEELFQHPKEAYTRALMAAVPKFERLVSSESDAAATQPAEVLRVENICACYPKAGKKLFEKRQQIEILHDISFTVRAGQIVGLVGESGCGKSTLARTILGLHKGYTGSIHHAEKHPQMIFQDAGSSLNPSKTVEWILEEPLKNLTAMNQQERSDRITEVLSMVQLGDGYRKRYPMQLSGGQRQRVSIALALMLKPAFLIADEPVSALDVTIQKQILQLLRKIVTEMGVSVLMISHDLRVVYQLCDEVLVMKDGKLVESGSAESIYRNPQHEYTKALLKSAGAEGIC